jgi:hypothetical protein
VARDRAIPRDDSNEQPTLAHRARKRSIANIVLFHLLAPSRAEVPEDTDDTEVSPYPRQLISTGISQEVNELADERASSRNSKADAEAPGEAYQDDYNFLAEQLGHGPDQPTMQQ